MKQALSMDPMTVEQDQHISSAIARERNRLKNFIRKRVADEADVEDILQDVFYELVEAYRLMKPVGHISAWLFAVARNRIIDLFRKRKPVADEGAPFRIEDMLPSRDAALEELPEEQRAVFIAHEFEGRSFKEMAAESGVSVNTLLSRKHYAVQHL